MFSCARVSKPVRLQQHIKHTLAPKHQECSIQNSCEQTHATSNTNQRMSGRDTESTPANKPSSRTKGFAWRASHIAPGARQRHSVSLHLHKDDEGVDSHHHDSNKNVHPQPPVPAEAAGGGQQLARRVRDGVQRVRAERAAQLRQHPQQSGSTPKLRNAVPFDGVHSKDRSLQQRQDRQQDGNPVLK